MIKVAHADDPKQEVSSPPKATHGIALSERAHMMFAAIIVMVMMGVTALTTQIMVYRSPAVAAPIAEASAPDLDGLFPDQFGDWSRVDFGEAILPAESTIGPGEAVAYRAWRNSLGRIVTLVVAYGPPASDSVRLHRPETCYTGQGFLVEWRERGAVSLGDQFIPVNRLMTRNAVRSEAVSYWLRAGDNYAVTAAAHQWINLQQGLGRTADGVLVRMSTSGGDDREFDLHVEFIENLLAAMTPQDRKLLIASGDSLQS